MDTISYSAARNQLARTMDKVNDNSAPVIITRQRGKPAVLMSLEEYEAMTETAHLLSSPVNAARLRKGLREFKAGRARAHKLVR